MFRRAWTDGDPGAPGHIHDTDLEDIGIEFDTHQPYLTVGPAGDSSYITDGTADNVQIQAAIAALASTGGVVQLQKGTYNLAAGLTITASNITLQGAGFGSTKLLLNNSVNATALAVSGTGTVGVGVFDLTIDGNKANQTSGSGISINTPYSTTDTMHLLRNSDVVNAKDDGIVITGDTRVVRMFMVRSRYAGQNGFSLAGSDHQLLNSIGDGAGRSGFVLYCTNGEFVGCKAFYCDSAVSGYSGWRVEGQRNTFTTCFAQDNNEHGWRLISAHGTVMTGCVADSNGTNYTDAGSGLSIESSNNCSIIGGAYFDRAAAANIQKYGIVATGTPTGLVVFGQTFYGNATAPTSGGIGIGDAEQFITNTSTYTLTSQTAAQKLFNVTTNGAITLPIGTYFFECQFDLSSMSGTSGSFGWTLAAGTATISAIKWHATANKAALATAVSAQESVNTAANTAIATATANTVGWARITGKVRVSVAGTVIPQVSLTVAAAAVVSTDSYFRIWPAGLNTVTNVGAWS